MLPVLNCALAACCTATTARHAANDRRRTERARVTGLSRNAVYLARRRVLDRLAELGATIEPAAAVEACLREAVEEGPRPTVERAVTAQVEHSMRAERGGACGGPRE